MPATIDFVPPPPPKFPTDATLTADDTGAKTADVSPPESLRDAVPGYEILKELGRGGMGVVYLARDRQLNRPVALKMILSGEHASPTERDRFRREAEAVAALQHPNIVQIYDIGEAQGRPFLAFEYVGGGSLSSYLDGQPWPAKPAASLIEALARAMQFAHSRGIVHRDLKPANVLIQNAEVAPRPTESPHDPLYRLPDFALRVPKITDFGLAKRVDPDSSWSDESNRTRPVGHTRTGAVVGTPSYIAPEQAAGKNRLVGPAVDVYALGAILYELMTGRPPFRGETPLDTVLQVMGDDPVPPAELNRKVPRDLQTICLKCLHKEPRKRYATAEALADDLRRFQQGESIAARPVGRWERAAKWMNRHPAATVLGTTSAIAVVSLLAVRLYFSVELRDAAAREEGEARAARDAEARAKSEQARAEAALLEVESRRREAEAKKQEADARRREAERGVYALQLFKAAALGERDPQRAMKLLDDRNRCPEELRDFTWRYLRGQSLITEQIIGTHQATNGIPPAARVVHSPNGLWVVTVSGVDPVVRVYDVAKRRLAFTLVGHGLAAHGVAFADDSRTLATAGGDNTVRLWELPRPEEGRTLTVSPFATLTGHTNTVNSVAFEPHSRKLASAGADGSVRIWDIPERVEGKPRKTPAAAGVLKDHTGPVWAVAWSAAGLFSAGSDGRVVFWRVEARGGKPEELFKLKKQAMALAASPDGEMIAAAGDAEQDEDEPVIQLYRPLTDRKAGVLRGHTGLAVYDLCFAADGKRLASAGRDGTVRVWDVGALQERAVFRPERERSPDPAVRAIRGVGFGPDGLSVVSGGQDGVIRQWSFPGQREEEVELAVRAPLAAAVVSADGGTLAVAERSLKQIDVWKLGDKRTELPAKPMRILRGMEHPPVAVGVSENGSLVAAAAADGVYVWRLNDQADDRPTRLARTPAVSVAVRGNDVVFTTDDGQIHWLDAGTGKPRFRLSPIMARPALVAFSPDGRKLISAGTLALQIWDATTGELLFETPLAHTRRITAIAARLGDTTDKWDLATADEGGLVKVWEFQPKPPAADGMRHPPGQLLSFKERPSPSGLNDSVLTLAFTADGRTLATGGADRVVRLRDPETGQERASLAGHTDVVLLVAFRADQVLLTVGREGFARVWRAGK